MSEPRRLVETSGLAGSLLQAGIRERPTHDVIRRATLALSATALTTSASAAAAHSSALVIRQAMGSALLGSGSTTTWLIVAKWVGAGFLASALTLAAVTAVEHKSSHSGAVRAAIPSPRAAQVAHAAAPSLAQLTSAPPSGDPTATPQPVPIPRALAPRAESAHAEDLSAPRGDPEPAPPANGAAVGELSLGRAPASTHDTARAFGAEVAFVDRQWRAMQSGRYASALSELQIYEARFPDLRLHPEVLFLRMQAQNQLGRPANAAALARQIVASYPNSAQATRARSILKARD